MSALAQIDAPPARQLRLSQLVDPNLKQREFLEATRRHRYVLYGGAAGGGKSYILRWWLLVFLLRAFAEHKVRNCRVGLFCEDYPSLRDRQISKIKHEFPSELGEIKSTKDEGLVYILREELGRGFVSLRNLEDASKYQSVEFAAIGVDELTKNQASVFEDLRMRLRWGGFPEGFIFPFGAATNPGSIGHAWVKQYWILRDIPKVLDAADFVYVKALASDNPKLPADYDKTQLATIVDEQKRKAFQDGDWDQFDGQYFHEWRKELHVCKPFGIPGWWRRWRASDFGFAAPWATLWLAMSPEGDVYVYRELYERQRDPVWMAARVKELSGDEEIATTYLDPACWDSSRGKSIAVQCAEKGWQCEKASNSRISGWTQVRNYLAWETRDAVMVRRPRLLVFDNCVNLIRTLPSLPYAAKSKEDVDTDAEDHAPDALRYGLMALPPLTIQPIETMTQEDAEALLRLTQDGSRIREGDAWPGSYA